MKVLICGGTGFIGRNIIESLSRQHDIEVYATAFTKPPVNIPNVTWYTGNLCDPKFIDKITLDVDVVVQAAAITSGSRDIVEKPYIHITDNAIMNSLILRACHTNRVSHFIFMSCCVMYPSRSAPWKEREWFPGIKFHDNYFGAGWTKIYIEKMCEFYSKLGVTKHTVVRHTNTYGPHDKYDLERSHVFGATVTKVMTNDSGTHVMWGDGEEERDLIYVSDVVKFIEACINKQNTPYELYNVGLGKTIKIKNLVHKIIAASGKKIDILNDISKPSIKTSFTVCCDKALSDFGWQPETSIEDGISQTMKWWRENLGVKSSLHES